MSSNVIPKNITETGWREVRTGEPIQPARRHYVRLSPDTGLIFAIGALLALGLLMVFSTSAVTSQELHGVSTKYILQHVGHVVLGLIVLAALQFVHPARYERYSRGFFLFCLLLLVVVLVPGVSHVAGGARRWISLGGFRFQPGELIKLAAVLYFAAYVGRHSGRLGRFIPGVIVPFAISGLCAVLLLLEPDFGTAVVVMLVVAGQLLVGGAKLLHLGLLGGCGLLGGGLLVWISPYRMRRFEAFLNPFEDPSNTGYQLIQSLIAVGSGGVTGVGLGAGTQKLFYLPAAHTDFIFAVIAEELGLLGAGAVLLLFLLIAWRGFMIARRLSGNPFLSTLAVGATFLIVVPAGLNIAVVTGLLPTKGLVLPLVSYGGSAMVMYLAICGLLIRLSQVEPE